MKTRGVPAALVIGALVPRLCRVERLNERVAAQAIEPMPTRILKKPRSTSRILHLNLVHLYFDQIAAGTKRREYRNYTPYWKVRLADRDYELIEFRNGYAPDARRMRVEFLGVSVRGRGRGREFVIRLGRILVKPTRKALSDRSSSVQRS